MAQEKNLPMSLEAAIDEERREVMNALQGRRSSIDHSGRLDQTASPAPPIRSMLDVSSPLPRNAPGSSAAHPAQQIRSMLDTTSPPPTTVPSPPLARSAVSSPVSEKPPLQDRNRSVSETSHTPAEGLRKIAEKHGVDINEDYQFEVLPSAPNHALPKRVSQGRRQLLSSSAMAAAMSVDSSRGRDQGRHNSAAIGSTKSMSPSSRLSARSQSPNLFHTSPYSPTAAPTTFVTDSGKVIDMDKAYRRLSDVAFRKLGSSLAPKRKGAMKLPQNDGEGSPSPDSDSRMHMDSEQEDQAVTESSGDDAASTDDDTESSRGRRRRRSKGSVSTEGDWADDESEKSGLETTIGMGRAKGPRQVQSLLAAAEEERVAVSSVTGEPTITVSNPAGERVTPKKSGVHPITSFDHTASGYNTEATSENEGDLPDIRRAQKLSINMSHIDATVPNRTMRTILRGDFARMEEEAEEGLRRQRMYLVATDLSDEAVYALEWTIGTILRDGDTLFAIYAIDDEPVSGGKVLDTDLSHKDHHGEGAKAAKEAFDAMASLTEKAKTNPMPQPSALVLHGYLPATDAGSRPSSADSRSMNKTEAERHRAIDEISQTCVRLLRKTRLQVRVAVEVIHCKSPKHLITEAIDTLSPTLVILGSRGRSALKGVLLGSFSNYLVTKSSVPVMVARKKLKKHAKYKPTMLSNNLLAQKRVKGLGLAGAKID